ncbi:MAG: dihydrofolate reductase [Flavobacteriales bacterium]
MIVSLIVAVAENNAIGYNNDLIWHLPNDMKYFKETTLNHHIITGRKNYISIPEKYRPLVNRTNIVLTRDKNFNDKNCIIKHSLEEALDYAKQCGEREVFIIGGGQIYKEALDKKLVDRMYITHVHEKFEADTFFPIIDLTKWEILKREHQPNDEKHKHSYTFAVYQKLN